MITEPQKHIPVLLSEVLDAFAYLADRDSAVFVDGTLGLAGHSTALALKLKSKNEKLKIIGIDKDSAALRAAEDRIKNKELSNNFTLVHNDFVNYDDIIHSMNIENVDGILLDLGVSSMQLDEKERGFSFQDPEQPLDMRMNQQQILSAETILNSYSESELMRVFKYAEEKYYKSIAKNICKARKSKKLKTVGDLLAILEDSIPAAVRAKSKKHFATNVFRGLRIETNDELSRLPESIKTMIASLKNGGKIAIITFHSTEDRIVKHVFKELANPCICPPKIPHCICGKKSIIKILTKKPLEPSAEEIARNPRARSAKLRVAERL